MSNRPARGYTLMVVLVLGLVLASLSTILLVAGSRDRREAHQQQNATTALYAAEGAVAIGVEKLRAALEETRTPVLTTLETETRTLANGSVPGATLDSVTIAYFDSATNKTTTDPPSTGLSTIDSGQNRGLMAQQSAIQVLASARVANAVANVADAIRIDLIPVFQFAIFFDGDMETQNPAAMTINGRVHANGHIYLSNSSSAVDFLSKTTSAKTIHSHTAYSTSVKVATDKTRFKNTSGTLVGLATDLPKANSAAQKTYLETTYGAGDANMVGDQSTGVQPLSVPIRLTSSDTCDTDSDCGAGRACVKVRQTDTSGVCMPKIISRPSVCSDSTAAAFPQSLAIEIIKRPKGGYDGDGALGKPYNNGVAPTDVYTADYGPRPAIVNAAAAANKTNPTLRQIDDLFEVEVLRSVPRLNIEKTDDDSGAVLDRMWWKADIRIIDGIWYKKNSNTPIFDPETVNYAATNPDPSDLNHRIARVIRYSWWWDAREGRVYCETSGDSNCVTDGKEFQRGQQIRSADFDASAFMALLADSSFRSLVWTGGVIPTDGIVVYMSETYDPVFEDAFSKLPRAANVRNFLNFPTMHNHLATATINAAAAPLPTRVAGARSDTGSPAPKTPYQVGWYPENIWGRNVATANFRSLTVPFKTGPNTFTMTDAERAAFYANPNTGTFGAVDCQDMSSITAARQPASRPADFTAPAIKEPCIQAGATPLGPENAVRFVRGQSLPAQGFTFVTDNRLYLHGDVNVRANNTSAVVAGTSVKTNQDIPGKIAFLADSVTILSDKFDERDRQDTKFQSFFKAPDGSGLGTFTNAANDIPPWAIAANNGEAPNMCTLGNTDPVDTRINASLLMGDVPSCDGKGDALGNRSGGLNNFPRFSENWASSVDNVINGSIVSLFRAEQGNARFQNSTYSGTFSAARSSGAYPSTDACVYNPPQRRWTFDDALLSGLESLPPGTPRVVATDRLRWVRR